ncbi:MAG: hypothetical protein PW843_06700 [Azospirillaceae bacterium]|nr:hypothetical protein [Azospirillaceae bacterium]
MHRLAYGFVLGYHGCTKSVADRLLAGEPFKKSENDYDWLGHGIYFWEANPVRGLSFAQESLKRKKSEEDAAVVGAVIEMGHCFDLISAMDTRMLQAAYQALKSDLDAIGKALPTNSTLQRRLDCAIIEHAHSLVARMVPSLPFDTVKGIFTEGSPTYPGAGFLEKTHIQIAVRNPAVVKGVFRVPESHLA